MRPTIEEVMTLIEVMAGGIGTDRPITNPGWVSETAVLSHFDSDEQPSVLEILEVLERRGEVQRCVVPVADPDSGSTERFTFPLVRRT